MIRIDLLRRCFWIQSTEFGNNELLKEENDCDERMESIAPEIVSVECPFFGCFSFLL